MHSLRRAVLGAALVGSGLGAAAAPASAAVPEISPYRFVHVHGARLAYRVAGHGRPLVLIAGFGLTAAEWDPALVDDLAAHRKVVIFDNRGVGLSTGSLRELTVTEMAEDTARLIRRLGLRRRPDVLGWSMGGYIAQELALHHPRRLRRLVLAGTDPGGLVAAQPSQRVLNLLSDPNATPDQLLPILFPPGRRAAGLAWYRRIGAEPGFQPSWITVSPAANAAQTKACLPRWAARGKGTWGRLPSLRRPVFITDGAKDIVVPTVNAHRLARRIPGARLRIFPDAGHAFLIQDHDRFARAVDRFLSRSARPH
jgi:pimeloyl-ACP methyl ester carboxylesterase